jgi:hypothetical protein
MERIKFFESFKKKMLQIELFKDGEELRRKNESAKEKKKGCMKCWAFNDSEKPSRGSAHVIETAHVFQMK